MWVKVCANTNRADAQLAAELGADAVGFVFAPSKRQVTPEQVAAITPRLPDGVEKVGVFTPENPDLLERALAVSGLTALQLHGAWPEQEVQRLLEKTQGKLRLIQVVGLEVQAADSDAALAHFEEELTQASLQRAVSAILLDAVKGSASGGLGVAFDWEAAAGVLRQVRPPQPVLLAGGLHSGNVAHAISVVKPDGVDVASGVEAEPGRKSPERLRAFLQAVRNAN